MKRTIKAKYYSRLLRVNSLVVAIIIAFLTIVSILALSDVRKKEFLHEYDLALHDLVVKYESKHDDFYRILYSLLDTQEGTMPFITFLTDSTNARIVNDYSFSRKMYSQMKNTALMDKDIRSIFVYKAINDSIFSYSLITDSIRFENESVPYGEELRIQKQTRESLGTRLLELSPGAGDFGMSGSTSVYAVLSTYLGTNRGIMEGSGVAVCYDEASFQSVLANRGLDPAARFMIVNLKGDVIFDSYSEYNPSGYTYYALREELFSNESSFNKDGKTWIKAAYMEEKRNFTAFYYLPEERLNAYSFSQALPIFSFSLFFVGLTLLLMKISTWLFSKRMEELELGMSQIGKNYLAYRIPQEKRNDEFARIAGKFNEMCDDLQEQIEKEYLYRIREQSAEFQALRAMINPHFLYNTLEAIRERMYEHGQKDAAEMIVLLSRLFQYQIRGGEFASFGEELENLRIYIEFFSLRYDGRFLYKFNIPSELLRFGLPKLSLQPIIENYFIHGILSGDNNEILVEARKEKDGIFISFSDNGRGIKEEKLETIRYDLYHGLDKQNHLGLTNVKERIRIAFGESYGLFIDSDGEGKGTTITLYIAALFVSELTERRIGSTDLLRKGEKENVDGSNEDEKPG